MEYKVNKIGEVVSLKLEDSEPLLEQYKVMLKKNFQELGPFESKDEYDTGKKLVFDATLSNFPELKSAYNSFRKYASNGKLAKGKQFERTPEEKLGHRVSVLYAAVCRGFRSGHYVQETKEDNGTVAGLIEAWVAENDLLPSTKAMSHFSNIPQGSFSSAMHRLGEKGWKFENIRGEGYKVIERPKTEEKKVELTESQLNEIIAKAVKEALGRK